MPELPDLEAIKGILQPRLADAGIEGVEIMQPLVIRQPSVNEFISALTGNVFRKVDRRGKFLLFTLESEHILAINLMLSGRLQYCTPGERRKARTCFIFNLEGERQLRYFDRKLMGKVYLVEKGNLSLIPRWGEMGPEPLDEEVPLDVFHKRLKRHSGQIKNILLNDTFLAGIGNAYADEILFAAGIYPYRLRTSLSIEEIKSLYQAMHSVLKEATGKVAEQMGEDVSVEARDFLKVHGKGGGRCPQCGGVISEIQANRRLTNFCRSCQKSMGSR